jgi:hypothetical protein
MLSTTVQSAEPLAGVTSHNAYRLHYACVLPVFFFFFFSLLVGGGVHTEVHAALRPVIVLLYLSRVIVRMEKLVE